MAPHLAARTARRLALAAAAATALFLGAELALRAAHVGAPAWHRPDPVLGWRLRPGARGEERGAYAEVNRFGRRDAAPAADKRPGVYRIAVLGGALSEAIGVPLRDTWWWRLPAALDRCGFAAGRRIEVLNFGVAGYSTAQEWLLLQSGVMRYQPDLVLLQFSAADVRENSRALASRLDRPFYTLDARGRLRLDDSFVERAGFERRSGFSRELARRLADRSRVLQILGRIAAGEALETPAAAGAPPEAAKLEEARRVTGALLARMRGYTARNGARFVLLADGGASQEAVAQAAAARLCAATDGAPGGPSPGL